MLAGVFSALLLVELLKGHGWRAAGAFSGFWALISTCVFVATRMYRSNKGQACAICKDTPE